MLYGRNETRCTELGQGKTGRITFALYPLSVDSHYESHMRLGSKVEGNIFNWKIIFGTLHFLIKLKYNN